MQRQKKGLLYRTVAATVAMVLLAAGAPISASTEYEHPESYEADPLGLIALFDTTSYYTNRTDVFEVWICEIAEEPLANLSIEQLVDNLNRSGIPDFYESVSGGRYQIRFVPGETIYRFGTLGCRRGLHTEWRGNTGALYAVPELLDARGGSPLPIGTRRTTYPRNDREAVAGFLGGLKNMNVAGIARLISGLVAWPRSHTGILPEGLALSFSDNPMDMASAGNRGTLHVGAIAVNRYAAGWIEPDDVHIYNGGAERVTLSVDWESGTQMLVLPTGTQGNFLSLGARVAKRHDRGIPKEGVEAYLVLQDNCSFIDLHSCWGVRRRTIPYPHDTRIAINDLGYQFPKNPVKHVLGVGQSLEWNGITVTVLERIGDKWVVEVTYGVPSEPSGIAGDGRDWFADDDGSGHEAAINRIAELGVTVGCATEPQPRFCPDRQVTRAEMAAFMLRAIGQSESDPRRIHQFEDVPDGVWYADFVHAFAELGVDRGTNGRWRPTDPLTRLEMAYWLTAVFDHITPVPDDRGLFEDVDRQDWVVVEGVFRVGVTYGCSDDPLLYCPDSSVTRGQMASFITRALR